MTNLNLDFHDILSSFNAERVEYTVRGREELLRNKRAVGRPQDQADVARLEAQLRGARNP